MNAPMRLSKDGSYEVGYCRPPTETQFRRGLSGNPAGRPKKREPTLAERIDARSRSKYVLKDGREISWSRLMVENLIVQAHRGKRGSIQSLFELIEWYEWSKPKADEERHRAEIRKKEYAK